MAVDTYFRQYRADVIRDDLQVVFLRLYTDVRDVMSDSPEPDWMAVDDFIIKITGLNTVQEIVRDEELHATLTRTKSEKTGEIEIRTREKQAANWIWWLAQKKGLSFEELKAMVEKKKF